MATAKQVTGKFKRAHWSVKMAGAVGDGVTDDGPALQAAINAPTVFSQTGCADVFLEAGTYLCSVDLTIPSGTLIHGHGPAASIIRYTGTGTALGPASPSTSNQRQKFRVRDLAIVNTGSRAGTGISMAGMQSASVERCLIQNFSIGVDLDGSDYGCYFDIVRHNVIFADTGVRLKGSASQAANENKIVHNQIGQFTTGILEDEWCYGNDLRGTDFENPNATAPLVICIDSNGKNPKVAQNWLEVAAHAGQIMCGIRATGKGATIESQGQWGLGAEPGGTWVNLSTQDHNVSISFSGSGLDDATAMPYAAQSSGDVYEVQIDGTGTPDTFKWRKNAGSWTTGVALSQYTQEVADGVGIIWQHTTGHTIGDQWTLTTGATITPALPARPPGWSQNASDYRVSGRYQTIIDGTIPTYGPPWEAFPSTQFGVDVFAGRRAVIGDRSDNGTTVEIARYDAAEPNALILAALPADATTGGMKLGIKVGDTVRYLDGLSLDFDGSVHLPRGVEGPFGHDGLAAWVKGLVVGTAYSKQSLSEANAALRVDYNSAEPDAGAAPQGGVIVGDKYHTATILDAGLAATVFNYIWLQSRAYSSQTWSTLGLNPLGGNLLFGETVALAWNAYYVAPNWHYYRAGAAYKIEIAAGALCFYSAVAGSKDAAISWVSAGSQHTAGTDQALDTGGPNEVTAAQAKTAYTHSQTLGNPHGTTALSILPSLTGNGGKSLKVKIDESGIEWA